MPQAAPPRSAAARAPVPKAGPVQCLVGFLGPGVHNVFFEPSKHLWLVWGLILNVISPLLLSCWGFSFGLGHGLSFFGGIQHSPIDGVQQ